MLREDLLAHWPGHATENAYPGDVAPATAPLTSRLAAMLARPERDGPATRLFWLRLLGPVLAAGYDVRPLRDEPDAHAVVDQDGRRIGLIMPIRQRDTDESDANEGSRS